MNDQVEDINLMREELNRQEQYSRRECLEISGIPFQESENTNDIVIEIGKLVGIQIQEEDISVSHRLPVTDGCRSTPAIIVKFIRRVQSVMNSMQPENN